MEHDRDSPIFYNFITDTLFRSALKQYFQIEESSQDTGQQADELTYDEKNIVRYVAGALYRAVQDKVMQALLSSCSNEKGAAPVPGGAVGGR